MAYLELVDSEYTRLRKDLLKEKGGTLQREFLRITRESASFISWIEERVGVEDENKDLRFDLWAGRLSESEYKDSPKSVEKELFDKWRSLTPAQASQETFWGYVTLEHIKHNLIESCYLAANGGNLPGGLERIDKALACNEAKPIDSIVRTILRRFSGLPEARGSKSVYVNCPFARAWWRNHVANEVCQVTGAKRDKVVEVLVGSQEYWERLIVLIVSRNSVLGDVKVRTALVWALSEFVEDDDLSHIFKTGFLAKISRQIGIRSAWQELGVYSVEELKAIITDRVILPLANR